MYRYVYLFMILMCFGSLRTHAQVSYFPPLSGTTWDTISPASQGWCRDHIDSLYNYLEQKNSKAFIILIDGKIVLEKYFGTFTRDSIHYWASAGKSLTSMLVGITQEKGLLNINNPVSSYIGAGWTSAPSAKENLITVKHLLTMTSGLDDAYTAGGCANDDTAKACLQYLADAGTRWAYHTGAYRKLQAVVSTVNGGSYLAATNALVGNHIGMTGGFWYNGVYYSTARSMARYGLLMLNKGIWNNDTVLHDTNYYKAMINTSQSYNQSYGYLWWLNGKASYMLPQTQLVGTGTLIPNAPADMFCALGKNDQKIYVVPGRKMVVVRMGETSGTPLLALSSFDNEMWKYINNLPCGTQAVNIEQPPSFSIYPNPASDELHIQAADAVNDIVIYNAMGTKVLTSHYAIPSKHIAISLRDLPQGMYLLQCNRQVVQRFTKE